MSASLTIAYFGLPLGALCLHQDGHCLAFTVLSPVDAVGRRRLRRQVCCPQLDALEMDRAELEARVDVMWRSRPVDLLVSWFWTRRLPAGWIEQPRFGAIGCHPSLLPRHRGPDPYFWTIDSGDALAGVSVHRLETSYDTGRVLAQRAISVGNRDAWQLARALDRPGLALLRCVLVDFSSGTMPAGAVQDSSRATWAPTPSGDLLRVNFCWPTERVLRRMRALAPLPGVALEVEGLPFRVAAATRGQHVDPLVAGEAFIGSEISIQTADGAVKIERAWISDGDQDTLVSGSELAALVSAQSRMISCPRSGDG